MNHYYKQLTWLRGIAAFLVICSHSLRAINVSYFETDTVQSPLLLQFFSLGTFGVLLFFVLSGCTLYLSYESKVRSIRDTIAFYIKRFFRIWPAFIISLLIYFCFRFIFQYFYPEPMGYWIEHQFLASVDVINYLTYPTLSFNFFGDGGLFNTAYWSLPVEFQYYLLFPIILISIRYLSIFGPIAFGLLFYVTPKFLPLETTIDLKFFLLAYSFFGGMLVGYIYNHKLNKLIINKYTAISILIATFVLISFVKNDWYILPDIIFISNKWNFYALSAIALTLLMLCTQIDLPKPIDSLLSFMGNVSYSTYLYHNIMIGIAIIIIIQFNLIHYKVLMVFLFASLLTYILSYYSYKYIEQPGMQLGKKYSKHFL